MAIDLCSFFAFKGSGAAQKIREPPSWKVETFVPCSPLPLQEYTGAHYAASAFHVIIWITKERHKMDGSPFISRHHGRA